jgi:2-polyprenyl-3-methyl-5-hydroxy-6-metoxy-1,4-benzoquinol methylase
MNNISCPNCGSSDTKKHLETKDYFLTQDSFSIYECHGCKVLFTHPFPESDVLYSKYYKSDDYLSHSKKSSDLLSATYRIAQKINIRIKLKLINSVNKSLENKILEVGSGIGDFLKACEKKRWKCFGIEPSDTARGVAKEFNDLTLYSNINEIGEREFSVITMWHVLEHIANLKETVLKLKGLLSENGALIIAVPNHNSFDAKHYKQFWAGYDIPRHLYHFNKESLTSLMEQNGLKLIRVKSMVFDSFYVSVLSEKYKHNTFIINILKALTIGLISNIKALFSRESSSLIFVFRKSE